MSDYTHAQWTRIKSIRPSAGRMAHVSKRFIRNPLSIQAEMENKPFDGVEFLPLAGETLNIGRNKAKREKRTAMR